MATHSAALADTLITGRPEPDLDHLRARNARSVWHPMAHPGAQQATHLASLRRQTASISRMTRVTA
ncbi:MAG: hypothetical protein CM1200mP20_03920 [Pseudomonadota bacterium]|nr:MAG: hypothetical protein CM1200mP20_03920 [Pseudomonadota bacterium]